MASQLILNLMNIMVRHYSEKVKRGISIMHNFEIKIYDRNSANTSNVEKFMDYCKYSLPKKKGLIFHVTPDGAMIQSKRQMLFQILKEIDKLSISVKTIKKAKIKD